MAFIRAASKSTPGQKEEPAQGELDLSAAWPQEVSPAVTEAAKLLENVYIDECFAKQQYVLEHTFKPVLAILDNMRRSGEKVFETATDGPGKYLNGFATVFLIPHGDVLNANALEFIIRGKGTISYIDYESVTFKEHGGPIETPCSDVDALHVIAHWALKHAPDEMASLVTRRKKPTGIKPD